MPTVYPSRGPALGGGMTSGGGATAFPLPGLPQMQSRGRATVPTPGSMGQSTGVPLDEELQARLARALAPSHAGPETTVETPIGMTEPPKSPEEKERRKKGFRALLDRLAEDPNAQQAMLMAAAQILQPIQAGSGETVLNRLVQGAVVGTDAFASLNEQDAATAREEERLEMERTRLDLSKENLELNKISTEAQLEIARERLGISKQELELRAQRLGQQDRKATLDEMKAALQIEALQRDKSVEDGQKALNRAFFESAINDPTLQMTESQQRQLEALVETDFNAASEFVDTLRGGGSGDQRDRKIQDRFLSLRYLAEQNGTEVSDPELMRIATGLVDETILPQETDLGIKLVDTEKGALGLPDAITSPQSERSTEGERAAPPLAETAVGAVESGTGLLSGLMAATSRFPFREGISEGETEVVQDRLRLRNINNNLINSLRLNNRAQREIERIKEQLSPLEPGIWRPTAKARAEQKSVDTFLANEIRKLQRDIDDPTIPPKKREDAKGQIQAFENARDSLGIRQFEAVLDKLNNDPASLLDQMTAEDAQVVLDALPEEEIRALPRSAKEVLEKILSGQ